MEVFTSVHPYHLCVIAHRSLNVYLLPMSNAGNVFVLDKDRSARHGLVRLLRAAGHDVRDFASAREFLDILDADTSGCLVLDAGIAETSGAELLKNLRSKDSHLAIIVMTAGDSPRIKGIAREMKAKGCFRKPIDGSALLDTVDWALR